MQVSLQTTGNGNVRFRGDVLWDYTQAPINRVQYIYNRPSPYPSFNWFSEAAVAELRRDEPARSTGYYGLNVGVERGTVTFGGNIGLFGKTYVESPVDRLGKENTGNGLWVTIHTDGDLLSALSFGASSKVAVSNLRVAKTRKPDSEKPDSDYLERNELAPFPGIPLENVVFLERTLPTVTDVGGDPGIIGPGPRNVEAAGAFERVALPLATIRPREEPVPRPGPGPVAQPAPLGPIPASPPPEAVVPQAGATPEATLIQPQPTVAQQSVDQQAREAAGTSERAATEAAPPALDVGSRSAGIVGARDAFASDLPLTALTSPQSAHADDEYFSQGAFEFAETLSRRTRSDR